MSDAEEAEAPQADKKRLRTNFVVSSSNAGKGDVRQLFSRLGVGGDELEDDKWRCVLWHKPGDETIFSAPNGLSNLRKHLLSRHGITFEDEGKAVAGPKKPKAAAAGASGMAPLPFTGAPKASQEAINVAVARFIIMEQKPFALAIAPAFQDMKTALVGRYVAGPSPDMVRNMLDAEYERLRGNIIAYLDANVDTFSLAGDGKKATVKGLPMYAVTLHALTKGFDFIVLPLVIEEVGGKTAMETKQFILKSVAAFKLSAKKLLSFTGDEAESKTAELLGVYYIKCAAHRISTTALHAFKGSGLVSTAKKDKKKDKKNDDDKADQGDSVNELADPTVDATKEIVQFCVRRYRPRQVTDSAREKLNEARAPGDKILNLTEFSKTRFLGSLLMGHRFVMNEDVITEVHSYALGAAATDPWHKWPGYKERYGMEWRDILFVCQDLVPMMERLCGERFATVSEMIPRIMFLLTRLFRLTPGPPNKAHPHGEPPIEQHVWETSTGPKFVRELQNVMCCLRLKVPLT